MSEPDITREQPAAPPFPSGPVAPTPAPLAGPQPGPAAPPPPPPGGPVPPPPPPHGPHAHHHHRDDKPWYRQTWAIVVGCIAALLIAFGMGTVFGGTVGYVIGVHHGDRGDRFGDMPMWSDDGMPWSQDGDTGRERGRGFGGLQSGDGSGNGFGQGFPGFGQAPGGQMPDLESDGPTQDGQMQDGQTPNGPSNGTAPQMPGSDAAPSPGTSG